MRHNPFLIVLFALALLGLTAGAALVYSGATSLRPAVDRVAEGRTPVGILVDSDSQSYQGRPPLGYAHLHQAAGGAYHAITFQWPEVLHRLRGSELDLGRWSFWGVPRPLSMARVRDGIGLRWRAPRKEDYRHNLAWPSGCAELHTGPLRQAQRLVDLMDENPQAWAQGVVVIRSGVNDFGKESLDALARDAADPTVRAQMEACVGHIRQAIALIRERHPSTGIVVVGILNNVDWPAYFRKYQDAASVARIDAGLNHFDQALRGLAAGLPRVAFFDDRAWFARRWGSRDANGLPAYRSVAVGSLIEVSNAAGDHPRHSVLANGHAGLVWNLLWTQELVSVMRTALNVPVSPITDEQLQAFLEPLLEQATAVDARLLGTPE